MLRDSDKITHRKNLHVRGKNIFNTRRQDNTSRRLPLHGFTLIELLVVVAIISLLVSILLPSLSTARELARTAVCASNLKQMNIGTALYLDDNNSSFFPANYAGNLRRWYFYEVLGQYCGLEKDAYYTSEDYYGERSPKVFDCPSSQAGYESLVMDFVYSAFLAYPQYGGGKIENVLNPSIRAIFADEKGPKDGNDTGYYLYWARWTWEWDRSIWWYRHNESANIAFVDGHVSRHSKDDALNQEIELNWPGMLNIPSN